MKLYDLEIPASIVDLVQRSEQKVADIFKKIDEDCLKNSNRVLASFRKNMVIMILDVK